MSLFKNNTYFYHSHMRKIISVFGYVFSDLSVARFDSGGEIDKMISPIPIKFANEDTDLALNSQGANSVENKFTETFPRMTYQLTNLQYNSERRHSGNNRLSYTDKDGSTHIVSSPAPFIASFSLNIIAKNNFDAQQIFEQIAPAFTPFIIVKIKDHPIPDAIYDLPISMVGTSFEDNYTDYEGGKRRVVYTLDFEVMFNIYGPTGRKMEFDAIIHNITSSAESCGIEITNDIDNLRGKNSELDRLFKKLDMFGSTKEHLVEDVCVEFKTVDNSLKLGPYAEFCDTVIL